MVIKHDSYLTETINSTEKMKRNLLALVLLAVAATMNAALKIDRIEPADWYVGMKNKSLQLMVYGKDVRAADVRTDYPGVRIDSIVRPDSPNYLFVYLNLNDARPGVMTLDFSGKKVRYRLKKRDKAGEERIGFTNADVLYMLMPDRFASGNTSNDRVKGMMPYRTDRSQPSLRHGGDLEGIRRHLDYFCRLGVTALWLTPVLENNSPDNGGGSSYHGYATTDYYKVDPRFGTNEEYRRLTDEAHAKGLKVMMDMIFNHCGFDHPWVKDMPFRDWFNTPQWLGKSGGRPVPNEDYLQTTYRLTPVLDPYASKVDTRETVEGWFVPGMPDLNQDNPHVMTYLIQNSKWWIETVGIDGIRMDTYPYAFAQGMSRWMKELNDEYPNFNTVGETWVAEPAYTAAWQKDARQAPFNSNLKTVMDFSFYEKINQAKREDTDGGWSGMNRIYNNFVYDYLYPNPESVMAFIDNHDTDRFLGNGCDTLALKQALSLLLTVRRIPQIYYGTEILMNGTKEFTDGNVRKDFPGGFPGDKHNAFTAEGRSRAENDMFNWLSRLLHWRQGNEVITKGGMTQFVPFRGVYVINRSYKGRSVLVVINGKNVENTFHAARYSELNAGGKTAVDVTSGRYYSLGKDFRLTPRQALVLEY